MLEQKGEIRHQSQESLVERIIRWAQDLPLWQADAVRRLLQTDSLTGTDKDEILLLLKAEHGLVAEGVVVPAGRRPQLGDISGSSPGRERLTLCAIQNLRDVNAIPDGSSLPIGHTGLTVVYGENGSGKSGYARVLKLACRARGSEKTTILPNVFTKPPVSSGPASAEFVVRFGDRKPVTLQWTNGKADAKEMTGVAVFDSDCARYTLDKENKPLYSPYGAFVFSGLAALMKDLKDMLEREKPALSAPETTGLAPASPSLLFVAGLSAATTQQALAEACSWDANDAVKLDKVEREAIRLDAEDPAKLAAQAEAAQKRAARLTEALRKTNELLSDTALEELTAKRDKLVQADGALKVLRESIADEPLHGVGSDKWRALYDAAKEYSTKLAYPDKGFPYTGQSGRCVFCQQELLAEGRDRLERFKAFMESRVTNDLIAAKAAVAAAEKALRELTLPKSEDYEDVIGELENTAPKVAAAVIAYLKAVPNRHDVALASPQVTVVPFPACPLDEVERIAVELGQRTKGYREKPKSELLTVARRKLADLQSRKALAPRRTTVEKYVEALQKRANLEACQKVLNPRAVTEKHDALVGEVLTQGLQDAFRKEMQGLAAPPYLAPRGTPRVGDTLLGLRLQKDGIEVEILPSAVLSEGEQRVVAIAGFLAELATSGHSGPIALDDPVCSLDHRFRDRIARRLAKEGLSRQVIVFTHDIGFLLELREQAVAQTCPLASLAVEYVQGAPGCVTKDPPWEAREWGQQLQYLRSELSAIRGIDATDPAEYNRRAAALYDKLRGSWETVIEDEMLCGVVRRHKSECKPTRLEGVFFSTESFKELMLQYTRCSKLGDAHAKARALDGNRPTPDEIAEDILKVERFVQTLRNERKSIVNDRRKSLEPRVPSIG